MCRLVFRLLQHMCERDLLLYARCAGKAIYGCKRKYCGEIGLGRFFRSWGMEGRPSAPEGANRDNEEIGEGSQRHPAGHAEKQHSPCHWFSKWGYWGVGKNAQHPLESGVEIQKWLESYPASKNMGICRRPRSASLGDIPKKLKKGEKRVAPSFKPFYSFFCILLFILILFNTLPLHFTRSIEKSRICSFSFPAGGFLDGGKIAYS